MCTQYAEHWRTFFSLFQTLKSVFRAVVFDKEDNGESDDKLFYLQQNTWRLETRTSWKVFALGICSSVIYGVGSTGEFHSVVYILETIQDLLWRQIFYPNSRSYGHDYFGYYLFC